jgi:predicted ATPase
VAIEVHDRGGAVKNRMAPNIRLAVVFFAAAAVVALRAAAKRPESRRVLVTEPAPATAAADESRPAGAAEQMQHVFHELHADGDNALCAVCDSQYRSG